MISKKVVIALGNGFSIDLVGKINKSNKIDLTNLFKNGDKVPWPINETPGFLSQSHCPELWKVGARPNIDRENANKIVDDIITCANVSAISEMPSINMDSNNIYIKAYHELVIYLKYLFIYYNKEICDDELNKVLPTWGWSKMFKNLNDNDAVTSVTIITYNYDILLERVLKLLGIDYQMLGFQPSHECKFKIIKPHGSISFRSSGLMNKEIYSIQYNRDSFGGKIEELVVDDQVEYDKISKINTMIPPSGESERYQYSWSKSLRVKVEEAIKEIEQDDDVFFGGLSYCGVDRQEIDKIITKLDKDVNIFIVNPDSSNTFGAVISSIFTKYIHYTDSDVIGGLYNA